MASDALSRVVVYTMRSHVYPELARMLEGWVMKWVRRLAVATGAIGCGGLLFGVAWRTVKELQVENQIPGYPMRFVPSRMQVWWKTLEDVVKSAVGNVLGRGTNFVAEHEERFRHYWRKHFRFAESVAPCYEKVMHGHPRLAANRRGIHEQAALLLKQAGYEPYDISSSRRSDRLGSSGYHGVFSSRDYGYKRMNKPVSKNTAFVLIDVDYYVDMPALATHMKPMVLWTFNPLVDVGSDDESRWRIDGDYYEFKVNGGRKYRHMVWEYGDSDYVTFDCGLCRYTYAVERFRPPMSSHELVLLQPTCCGVDVPKEHLVRRRKLGDRQYFDGDCVVVVSGALEFRMRTTLYETVLRKLTGKVAVHTIVQYLKEHSGDLVKGDPSYVAQWFHTRAPELELGRAEGLTFASVVLRDDGTFVSNQLKPTYVRMLDAPTNVEARAPTNDRSSDAAAVTQRIAAVANTTVPDGKFLNYAREFVAELLKDIGVKRKTLQPFTAEEVAEEVERAATRAKIEGVCADLFNEMMPQDVVVEAFYKKELYAVPKDERNISPTQDEHLLALSRYTYALKKRLKDTHWYMPGKTPQGIAERVKDYCSREAKKWETDYSRFDGTISSWLRHQVEKLVYTEAFADSQVKVLIESEIDRAKAKTRAGSYATKGSRLSGSPLTTDGNTSINAYVQYVANRESGMSPSEAYQAIGLCYGDDGICEGEKMDEAMDRVTRALGLSIKLVEACTPSRPYVGFVGRIFPLPGTDISSFQDPMRVWPKIHLTRKLGDKLEKENFASKLLSFALTDGQTPVLGEYCRKALSLFPEGKVKLAALRNSSGRLSAISDSWLALESGASVAEVWPQRAFGVREAELYATLLGTNVLELEKAESQIKAATSLRGLSKLLVLHEEESSVRFVLDANLFAEGKSIQYNNNKAQPALGHRTKHDNTSTKSKAPKKASEDPRAEPRPSNSRPDRENKSRR